MAPKGNRKKIFIDTNILVYAYDQFDQQKHTKAKQLVTELWLKDDVIVYINVQVLKELAATLRKIGYQQDKTIALVEAYQSWHPLPLTGQIFTSGLRLWEEYQLSYWDSFIIAAAQHSGASELWSEDLNANQKFDDLLVVNPLNS